MNAEEIIRAAKEFAKGLRGSGREVQAARELAAEVAKLAELSRVHRLKGALGEAGSTAREAEAALARLRGELMEATRAAEASSGVVAAGGRAGAELARPAEATELEWVAHEEGTLGAITGSIEAKTATGSVAVYDTGRPGRGEYRYDVIDSRGRVIAREPHAYATLEEAQRAAVQASNAIAARSQASGAQHVQIPSEIGPFETTYKKMPDGSWQWDTFAPGWGEPWTFARGAAATRAEAARAAQGATHDIIAEMRIRAGERPTGGAAPTAETVTEDELYEIARENVKLGAEWTEAQRESEYFSDLVRMEQQELLKSGQYRLAEEAAAPAGRVPVESSNLASVGYDPTRRVLQVEFKGGAVYEYSNVPPELHEALMSAPSKGQFFISQVRSKPKEFPFKKLPTSPTTPPPVPRETMPKPPLRQEGLGGWGLAGGPEQKGPAQA